MLMFFGTSINIFELDGDYSLVISLKDFYLISDVALFLRFKDFPLSPLNCSCKSGFRSCVFG